MGGGRKKKHKSMNDYLTNIINKKTKNVIIIIGNNRFHTRVKRDATMKNITYICTTLYDYT